MEYKFVEIGVSNYGYMSNPVDGIGLSVEPFFQFVGQVERENVLWAPYAIGSVRKIIDGYYIPLDTIKALEEKIPRAKRWCMVGCSSIGKPHGYIQNKLKKNGIKYEDVAEIEKIRQITYRDLCVLYQIKHIETLKVDTEGMDAKILKGMLKERTHDLPKKIVYESHGCTPVEERVEIHQLLLDAGYDLSHSDPKQPIHVKTAILK